jgi:non-ribosomal peptide synthetase component E (peptide arylation enzyme)
MTAVALVSFARRLTDLAGSDPHGSAVTCGSTTLNRSELESRANRLARVLASYGVVPGDMVTIALTNSTSWFVAVCAAWKLGAIPLRDDAGKVRRSELRTTRLSKSI